jgi:hypothetical protein
VDWDEDLHGRGRMRSNRLAMGRGMRRRVLRMETGGAGLGHLGRLVWRLFGMGLIYFSGGRSCGVLGDLGWVGGTMEDRRRPGLVQANHYSCSGGATQIVWEGGESDWPMTQVRTD